jgi:hypothetical protein
MSGIDIISITRQRGKYKGETSLSGLFNALKWQYSRRRRER